MGRLIPSVMQISKMNTTKKQWQLTSSHIVPFCWSFHGHILPCSVPLHRIIIQKCLFKCSAKTELIIFCCNFTYLLIYYRKGLNQAVLPHKHNILLRKRAIFVENWLQMSNEKLQMQTFEGYLSRLLSYRCLTAKIDQAVRRKIAIALVFDNGTVAIFQLLICRKEFFDPLFQKIHLSKLSIIGLEDLVQE